VLLSGIINDLLSEVGSPALALKACGGCRLCMLQRAACQKLPGIHATTSTCITLSVVVSVQACIKLD